MRISIWYRDEEKRPARSGRYLAHRSFGLGGMADGDRELGYLYYNAKKRRWQEYDYDDDRYVVSTVYYWADMDTDEWIDEDGDPVLPAKLLVAAERIWKEDSTGIKFIKNRHGPAESMLVDEKEFLWIKLSATTV